MRERILTLASVWNKPETVNARKLELLDWSPALTSEVKETGERIMQEIHAADAAVSALKQPVKMFAKVEAGRIVAISPA